MTECWVWEKSTDTNGYGRVWIRDHFVSAPRLSWLLFRGGIYHKHVLHKCDNRRCFNPDHLFLGSHTDNMRDKTEKGRCPKPLAKLDWPIVDTIRNALNSGATCKSLAQLHGVDSSQIYRIKNNQTWRKKAA